MARIYKIEGLWIPETIEEAKQIVPTIDEEQFRKWRQDGAVELKVEEVYGIVSSISAILVDRTVVPRYSRVLPISLAELEVEVEKFSSKSVLDEEEPELSKGKSTLLIDETCIEMPDDECLIKLRKYLESTVRKITGAVYCSALFNAVELIEHVLKDLINKKESKARFDVNDGVDTYIADVVIRLRRKVYGYILKPTRAYILKLQEVNVPPDLLPTDVEFRSSFHRCGWIGKVTNIDPGYRGHIYVLLTPTHNAPELALEQGARVVQVRFLKLVEPLEGYKGQWQGR